MLASASGRARRYGKDRPMIASNLSRRSFLSIAASGLVLGAVALTATPSPASAGEGREPVDDAEQDLAEWRGFLARQRLWYGPEYAAWVADTLIEIAKAHAAAP